MASTQQPGGVRHALAAGLALLAMLPYLAAGPGRSFIAFDDPLYVSRNPMVLAGLTSGGLRWAITTFHAGNWHPLTWLSHMLDASLFGSDPRWHHVSSILLHGLTAAVLFLALVRMTAAPWRSALAVALFGVHPLRVESVAWVAERKDVLAGLFLALVLLAYERYGRRGGAWRYGSVALLLALGLAAKPSLATVPFLLLLMDVWPLQRTARGWWRLVAEKLPLAALSTAAGIVTFVAQGRSGAVSALDALPLGVRLSNALVSCCAYLGKILWPSGLAVYYPHPLRAHPWWLNAAAVVLLTTLTAGAILQARRRPFLAVGWFWFAAMLLPAIGLVQVGGQAMADRYTYLPQIGLCLAAAWLLPDIAAGGARARTLLAGAAAGVVALLAVASARQAALWSDSETLFTHALAVTGDNALIQASLGNLRYDQGQYAAAAARYREALRTLPGRGDFHVNLGNALGAMGRGVEALEHYREAARLQPSSGAARINLGRALLRGGHAGEAAAHLREAVRVRPDDPEAYESLAVALAAQGRRAEAEANLQRAREIRVRAAPR